MTGPGVNSTSVYNGLDTRVTKNAQSFLRDGAYVTDPVLRDGNAAYTPGISERRGSATTFQHSGLKNADAQSGIAQTLTATKQYDAFGNLASSTGTWQGPFGYAGGFGYQTESDSGLMLLGHRYMDPSTGRFLTRDPVKDGRNWYGYVGNNPIALADPTGLFAWVPIILGIIVIIDIIDTANGVAEIIKDPGNVENYLWVGAGIVDPFPGNPGKWFGKGIRHIDDLGEGIGNVLPTPGLHGYHPFPQAISKKIGFDHWLFDEVVPIPGGIHIGPGGFHSGKGYSRPGGHYNNWVADEVNKFGGPGEITRENVDQLAEMIKEMGLR